LIQKF